MPCRSISISISVSISISISVSVSVSVSLVPGYTTTLGQADCASFGPSYMYMAPQLSDGQISACCCWGRAIYQPSRYFRCTTGLSVRPTPLYTINDVATQISPYSRISLFADDMTLYRTIYVPADYNILQDDVTAISQWVDDSYMTLHTGKCCLMFVTRRHSLSNPPPPLYLGTSPLNQLGQLSQIPWNHASLRHVLVPPGNRVSTKVRKLTGLLFRRFY